MSRDPNYNDLNNAEKYYSEQGLVEKLFKYAIIAGKHVVYRCLLLKYALMSDKTSVFYKSLICGALGYFISPIDIIPDVIPVVGYTDDLTALTFVLVTLCSSKCISEEDREKAKRELQQYFKDIDVSDLDDF